VKGRREEEEEEDKVISERGRDGEALTYSPCCIYLGIFVRRKREIEREMAHLFKYIYKARALVRKRKIEERQ